MKINQFGRSMIEMLGVLAIIGVLSVGAIAGYQKAMMKYKLNKYTHGFNILVNNFIHHSYIFSERQDITDTNGTGYYSTFFHKLGLIPDGFKLISSSSIQDIFGNHSWIFANSTESIAGIGTYLNNGYKQQICHAIVLSAKENRQNIKYIYMQQSNNEGHSGQGHLYGDAFCNSGVRCLKDTNIEDINNICNQCQGECRIYIQMTI